jgi:hypothetical protein
MPEANPARAASLLLLRKKAPWMRGFFSMVLTLNAAHKTQPSAVILTRRAKVRQQGQEGFVALRALWA